MKLFLSLVACVCLASHVFAQNPPPVKVRALKDNTNLRAKPALNVEVAGQAAANQELTVKSMDAEWVEVAAPTNIDFWVLGDYLKDGAVVCNQKVNVRAGPGINFSVVGQLTNGSKVQVRGNLADWIKVAPPENCSLWVSRALVEIVSLTPVPPARPAPPAKPPVVEPAPARPSDLEVPAAKTAPAEVKKPEEQPRPALTPVPAPATNLLVVSRQGEVQAEGEKGIPAIKPPPGLDLIPEANQGQWKQFEGVLKSKNFLVRSPADFRLVANDQDGQPRTVCFVKGNRAQLDALLFRELIIYGRQYWVRRQRYPVIVPEKIILK